MSAFQRISASDACTGADSVVRSALALEVCMKRSFTIAVSILAAAASLISAAEKGEIALATTVDPQRN